MQIPLPGTYSVIQKNGSSVLPDVFMDILRLKVESLKWLGPLLSHRNFLNFIVSN
jgi:hypothetical protein